ncbi:MAG: UV DNA damage repair endonuclease UvsE [Alicyclobacillus macrosporangiidus]|uniref:UV DNA damage repair endonuclease UvsE n=1 Tax=Alicyclobacillus macrosporangiidus TaxID=392015 RepID=UPI0026E9C901|nr:UV DNA damage repair endonuclease UvsE [Alicyclobacillus macrosporangiidus]MCL6600338.1 UV DNA damage repair endonuclease UvsE [Alicyclobacillus macrosporangiidus]
MKVRFGFVAMALSLTNASPSQTMTYKVFQSIPDKEAALQKATRIGARNLENTLRILRHAKASGVEVYRFSSRLIPLFTHEATKGWDFIDRLRDHLVRIGHFVQQNAMRVSFHPEHFTVLNSPKKEVLDSSIRDLLYHVNILEAMELDDSAKLVIHIGGRYKDKESSLNRFIQNFGHVPLSIQRRLTLENDDKIYTAKETQRLCRTLGIPMIFDLHHHYCNHGSEASGSTVGSVPIEIMTKEELSDVVEPFLASWEGQPIPPKAHVSSPKDERNFRAHADYINPEELIPFLDCVREFDVDIDVMLEAKRKDEALFALMRELQKYMFINILSGGSIQYRP